MGNIQSESTIHIRIAQMLQVFEGKVPRPSIFVDFEALRREFARIVTSTSQQRIDSGQDLLIARLFALEHIKFIYTGRCQVGFED